MKERENMPEVSAAAYNMHSKDPAYVTSKIKPTSTKAVNVTCYLCGDMHNQTKALQVIKELPESEVINYDGLCLNCIKKTCQNLKADEKESLASAKSALAELTLTYQKAHNSYKAQERRYQQHDYTEKIILHHLTKPAKVAQASSKPRKKANEQTKKTALKILSNLTPEQQKIILALMAKQ